VAALGIAIDLLMAAFLLLVSGWIVDSWNDPVPWTGPIVTTIWTCAFAICAGAPLVARWLRRRQATPGQVALAVWLPSIVLITLTAIGFIVFSDR
jgi:hypothetical protein